VCSLGDVRAAGVVAVVIAKRSVHGGCARNVRVCSSCDSVTSLDEKAVILRAPLRRHAGPAEEGSLGLGLRSALARRRAQRRGRECLSRNGDGYDEEVRKRNPEFAA